MKVTMEKVSELSRSMSVTVPAEEVSQQFETRLSLIQKQVKMSGFRPGKVPMSVVRQRFGEQVKQEVMQELVASSMPKAFDSEKVRPATQPTIDFGDLEESKEFAYTLKFDVLPEVKPVGYTGVKLTKDVAEVEDKKVEEMLERLCEVRRSYAPKAKTGKAALTDRVLIDAQGYDKKGGKKVENTGLKGHPLELGSNAFIPGFEDGLVGAKAGDTVELDLTFPEGYHVKDLAGKPIFFEVKVEAIEKRELPALDDELAKSFGSETVEELRSRMKEDLEKDLGGASEQRMKRALFDVLDEANKFSVPEAMVDAEFNAIWAQFTQDIQYRGGSMDSLDKSEDEYRKENRELAERRVRLGLLIAEIAKEEKIQVTSDEMKAEVEKIAASYGAQAEQVKKYFSNPEAMQQISGPLLEKKVCDFIFEKAVIKENKVDVDDLMAELTA